MSWRTIPPVVATCLLSVAAQASEPAYQAADSPEYGLDPVVEPWPAEASASAPKPDASRAWAERSPLAIQLDEDFRLVPSLQYRVRYYHREGKDFTEGGATDLFRHRARFGFAASYRGVLEANVQLQDARTLGEETDTLGDYSADGFDLHQAYMRLAPTPQLELRIGRQEVLLLNSRLLGNVDFTEQGRSFDAARAIYQDKGVRLDAMYSMVRDYGAISPDEGQPVGKRHLGLLHLGYDLHHAFAPSIVGLAESDSAVDMRLATVGAYVAGKFGRRVVLDYSGEGYYQHGKESGNNTIHAFLFALRSRATADLHLAPFVEVRTALLSGDEDPNDITLRTFRTPYATGHKFHGEMDFFLNHPVHTQNRGLRDIGVKIGWVPHGIEMHADFHLFDAMADQDDLQHFGWELDFKARYPFWDYASVDALYGVFVPGEIFRASSVGEEVEHFAYVTLGVKL